jgi:hypothetical protein
LIADRRSANRNVIIASLWAPLLVGSVMLGVSPVALVIAAVILLAVALRERMAGRRFQVYAGSAPTAGANAKRYLPRSPWPGLLFAGFAS